MIKAFFEIYKVLSKLGIKPKDVIGMGGNIVKMGKSLFNTRINPKLITFIEKNQKIPTKILEDIKLHGRTLKNATENQKNLFLENIKSIQKAKTPPIPKSSSPVTGVKQPGLSVKEQAAEAFKGWKPTVIKGGKDGLATGGIANHFRKKFDAGGAEVQTLNPLFPTQDPTSTDFQPLDIPGAILPPLAIGAGAKYLKDKFFSKPKEESKEDIVERIETIKKEPDQEPPKYTSKDALRDLKTLNEFRKYFKKKEEDIQNTSQRFRRQKFDEEYLTAFELYKNKFHGGNIKGAAKSLDNLLTLGTGSFHNRIRGDKVPEGIITQVLSPPIEATKSALDIEASFGTFKTATNLIRENPKLVTEKVKTLIEEGALEGKEYYNLKTLADIFGIDKTSEYAVQTLGTNLKNLGVVTKTDMGPNRSERYFGLNDAVSKLTKWSKDKHSYGQGTGIVGPKERYKLLKKIDDPLRNLFNRFNQQLRKISIDTGVYQPWAHEDIGHPLSIKLANKYKDLLKGSNINELQTLVFQDPVVNQKILMEGGFENNYYEIFDQLKKFNNKKITEEDREKLSTIKTVMDDNYTSIMKAIEDRQQDEKTGSYFIDQEKRVPKISLKIPKVGETFTGSDIWADMSEVDLDFQIGNVSKINKKAKKYDDLNEKEQSLYKENLKNQYIDNLEKYYTNAGYAAEEIVDLLETFETGTAQYIGIPELAHGGLTGVDQYIINRGI